MCFFFKRKTAYEMRISDWSSDVCSSDLVEVAGDEPAGFGLLLGIRRHGIIFARLRRAPSSALRAPSPAAQEKGLGVAPLLRSGRGDGVREIGRASCRERVCRYV